ncbi:phage antirepressor protein [Nitratiruptor phage NrS-5]|uniref:phage antirepressor n=1 Tax=unclassified Nitratiruptor TaxID=2624044 RepID=UPI001916536E|nr:MULTISPECIES: phage antirepressor KilAC domain-containing protein [unclassified Nitratiruptor]BCD61708.1 phage antirepressor protein [Nitratiruptor sp. YY08-13]BCD65643.1 phage antirepressor protein [Nitratiruptor sp. YY08-26]BCD83186.1 phage antirepressor protein [Nitratiruptor phage NrS-4]BCD83245.1 phage antirepressor protein [Nitratiruptor phage NrS-5]
MDLQIFKNADFEIRGGLINGEPYFVANDISTLLGYANTHAMIERLDDDEKVKLKDLLKSRMGKNQVLPKIEGVRYDAVLLTESGLYSAILWSQKPEAKKFKRWVTHDVLPSIRKHGVYAKDELLNNPDLFIEALQSLKKEREARLKAQKELEANKPYVSFAKSVEQSVNSILIREWVKALSKENNVTIGEKRAFNWLRENGYLMKNNEPYQKWIDAGYFERVARTIATTKGTKEVFTTYITGKGQIKLGEKIVEDFKEREGVAS